MNLELRCINTVRLLSADAVQRANSGHPGLPMGAAPMAYALWMNHLRFDPKDPAWPSRDRFILSAGHGSMLLYSLLYLTGYDLTIDDIRNFRQLDSKTPGHPEHHLTPGVETTTGPLGQGFANGVGMAIAQKYLQSVMDKPGFPIFDYRIFAIVSDGDLMEGISSESASLAGHLELGNIIYLYDDNEISIEGDTDKTFTEDAGDKFTAMGWHVQTVADGNDVGAITDAITNAISEKRKPSLIKIKTQIGYGSPNKAGSESAHGSPLGEEELRLTKENLGFDPGKSFDVDEEVLKHFRKRGEEGTKMHDEWQKLFREYEIKHPEEFAEYNRSFLAETYKSLDQQLPVFPAGKDVATRQASGDTLNAVASSLPFMIGGSADLAPSNNTMLDGYKSFQPGDYSGRNLHFGVREHSMGAILNGIALTKPMTVYGGTFLIFFDYMKPAVRLAAIMGIRPIYVYTHDSIGLGEDGTTHQPIEHLASLRVIPNMTLIRPADANETAYAWYFALNHNSGPVALALTRQKLPVLDRSKYPPASEISKGAYALTCTDKSPDLIIIASGSELHPALEAAEALESDGLSVRVVNMASWELFESQSEDYRESILPPEVKSRISVEAGSTMGWEKYVKDEGRMIGMNEFGKSAPGDLLMKEFGFTAENIVALAKELPDRVIRK